jgi:hypothetical protein
MPAPSQAGGDDRTSRGIDGPVTSPLPSGGAQRAQGAQRGDSLAGSLSASSASLLGGEGLEDEGSAAHAGLIRSRAGNLLALADRRGGGRHAPSSKPTTGQLAQTRPWPMDRASSVARPAVK